MTIYLVRHGQDDESIRGGWSDHGLIKTGIIQSNQLGEQLSNIHFDKIFSSDLTRAAQTTEIIYNKLDHKVDIIYTDQLREINNGLLAGMLHEEAERKYPGLYFKALDFTQPYPAGESPKEFFQRISNFWYTDIASIDTKNVLLVTHAGVINIIWHLINQLEYSNKQPSIPVKAGSVITLFIP